MLFPLYTHVWVPAGTHHYVAEIDAKLVGGKQVGDRWVGGHININVTLPIVEEGFDGIVLKPNYRWDVHSSEREIYPTGDHTKVVNRHTEKRFIFFDSMVQGKIVRQ